MSTRQDLQGEIQRRHVGIKNFLHAVTNSKLVRYLDARGCDESIVTEFEACRVREYLKVSVHLCISDSAYLIHAACTSHTKRFTYRDCHI